MDGVQFVLHNPQYITEYTWGWSWGGLFVSLISLLGLLCIVIAIKDKEFDGALIVATGIAIIFGYMAYYEFSTCNKIETYSHSEYEVVVHEGVDCKEFLEKYEVIEQNGDLITIKEREIENDNT